MRFRPLHRRPPAPLMARAMPWFVVKRGLSFASALLWGLASALGAWAVADPGQPPVPPCRASGRAPAPTAQPAAALEPAVPIVRRPIPSRIGWLAFGGGADPPSNQISIEQNLRLASEVLAEHGDGVLLFAAGPGESWVQRLAEGVSADPLLERLGELFAPRADRATEYRRSALESHGAATLPSIQAAIDGALAQRGDQALTLVVAAHGDPGPTAADTAVVLWGGQVMTARDLATRLDRAAGHRPVRLVLSSCFSGGFAEIAFVGADPTRGAAPGERCGLFATTWDREASGCDPDPDRRVQEGYGLYFWRALEGLDRHGDRLEANAVDFDGDGRISLLEAHTRVRIASRSISIPTTTSERWLRGAAPAAGPKRPLPLPEEDAVIDRLGRTLAVDSLAEAARRRALLSRDLDAALVALEQLELLRDDALVVLQMALLERWPVLDDPYRPDFQAVVTQDRTAIRAALATEPPARAYDAAQRDVDRLATAVGEQEVRLALVERLLRAYETRALAARLNARGGPALEHYRRLLACERSGPSAP